MTATVTLPERRRASPLLVALLAAALVIFILYRIGDLLLIAFIAALIAVYLAAVTDLLARRTGAPRGVALIAALTLTIVALAGVGALLAPPLVQQTQDLIGNFPHYLSEIDGAVRRLAARYPFIGGTGGQGGEGLVSQVLMDTANFLRHSVLDYATSIGRIAIEAIAVLVMAIYLAYRPRLYAEGVVALIPPRYRDAAHRILADITTSLRSWIVAQLMDMIVLAILTGVGLWILGVPYVLAFAIFTGLVALIPFFGTIFSTVLPALLVLGDRGFVAFLAVASVGVIVHILEANIVNPLIMQSRVELPAVLTIFTVLAMGELGGLLGLLVAVPLLAIIMVIVRHVLLQRVYGGGPLEPEPPVERRAP